MKNTEVHKCHSANYVFDTICWYKTVTKLVNSIFILLLLPYGIFQNSSVSNFIPGLNLFFNQ